MPVRLDLERGDGQEWHGGLPDDGADEMSEMLSRGYGEDAGGVGVDCSYAPAQPISRPDSHRPGLDTRRARPDPMQLPGSSVLRPRRTRERAVLSTIHDTAMDVPLGILLRGVCEVSVWRQQDGGGCSGQKRDFLVWSGETFLQVAVQILDPQPVQLVVVHQFE